MVRNKHKMRADGRRRITKTYNGVRKDFYGKTDAEIMSKIAEYEKALTEPKSSGFTAIADSFWDKKEDDLAIDSRHCYTVALKRAKAEFGDTPINKVSAHDIYNFLLKFKAQNYSQKVISNTKTVLREVFDHAFILGEVESNPVNLIPKVKGKAKVPRQAASEADRKTIEKFKTESMAARMMYFMLYTGARLGECCALQWKDIDIDRKTASVTKTLSYGNSSTPSIKNSPKTEAGVRELQLLDNVIEILPPQGAPDDYIWYPGGLPRRRVRDAAIQKFKRSHDLSCTPHMLRHSYTSMLYEAGTNVKSSQILLGHSSITMTMDNYTHLNRTHMASVREDINKYVSDKLQKETAPGKGNPGAASGENLTHETKQGCLQ